MTLLVDVGNSRLKWADLDRGTIGALQAASHANWSVGDWHRALFARPGTGRVLVASVAGPAVRQALSAAAARAGCRQLEFVNSTVEAAGVRNAYSDPGLLGVDRWLAVIGAHHYTTGPCCVLDVGTAATVDAVTADGQHLGGFIVPGPALMVNSLLDGTSDLAGRSALSVPNPDRLFADNTRDAIERGCVLALAALADRALRELECRTGAVPALLVTGGAAGLVLPFLLSPAQPVPELVLRGLAVLATEAHGSAY